MTNAERHVKNKLTYFEIDGINFEIIKMNAEENKLILHIIAEKNGERIKIAGGNPIIINNPYIYNEKDGERKAFKEMIKGLIDGN